MTNHLLNEKSPYLLQHASNPVEWYPWGSDAFSRALREGKPIFLSIGYATCHWCHVMERESFQNPAIAKLMNEAFVNVKVDREELPEVDALYMDFAQAIMPSGGGWPLNVLLTPELKPFFASTYVPPDTRLGSMGMVELIDRIRTLWNDPEEREKLEEQADRIVAIFKEQDSSVGDELPGEMEEEDAAQLLFRMADPLYGGIKGAPKFPMGYQICFSLRHAFKTGDSRALFYVNLSLQMMHRGGIWDVLGGGFSRYSVDERWVIPHFEKMLYDNAILLRAYTEAWWYEKTPLYSEVVAQIASYLMRDMRGDAGAFYSAQDADSEGKEGLFYTWTPQEVERVLGDDGLLFCDYYNVRHPGNFEGRSVLHVTQTIDEFASSRKVDGEQLLIEFAEQREKLFRARQTRLAPFTDDKILTSWNGLTIYSLALAGFCFDNPLYLQVAKEALQFIQTHLWKEGRLLRRWREGEGRYRAGLDEYAFVIHALLLLFEIEGDLSCFTWATQLADILESEFKEAGGAYFLTDGTDPNVLLRRCEIYDSAEPSGNGIHCENLLKLYQITSDERYLRQAEDVLRAAKGPMQRHPIGCCSHLMALQRYLDKNALTLVVALNDDEQWRREITAALKERFNPHRVVIWKREDSTELVKALPMTAALVPIDGKTTLYPCYRGRCHQPLTDWAEMAAALTSL